MIPLPTTLAARRRQRSGRASAAALRPGLLLGLLLTAGCEIPSPAGGPAPDHGAPDPGAIALLAHAEEAGPLEPTIIRVTDGVLMATGFGLANIVALEGPRGLVIVDTGESLELGRAVRAAFAEMTTKPVAAIIYTHNHADHVFGARAFVDGPDVRIWSHAALPGRTEAVLGPLRETIEARSARMFGTFLEPHEHIHAGIGPILRFGPGRTAGYVPPTDTFEGAVTVEAGGLQLELLHTPGETADQIAVWWPKRKVLMPADNVYRAFPNLYTLRGTPYRDPEIWARSLDRIRALGAEFLVPGHTRPIAGKARIDEILRDTRDALQYVRDQSLRAMAAGWRPDEAAARIKLPPHLRNAPWLAPFYGTVPDAVRAIFAGTIGWFDGDAASLRPLPRHERAELWLSLTGGPEAVRERAMRELDADRPQAALELAAMLLDRDPGDAGARRLRIRALRALGRAESNPNLRHWYFAEARELEADAVLSGRADPNPELLAALPISVFFAGLRVNLDGPAVHDQHHRTLWRFVDLQEAWLLEIRRGIALAEPHPWNATAPGDVDLEVRTEAQLFKEMLAGLRNPVATMAGFEYPRGHALRLANRLRHFGPPPVKLPPLPAP